MTRLGLSSSVWLLIGALLLAQSLYLTTVKVTHFGVMLPAALGLALVAYAFGAERWDAWLSASNWRLTVWRVALGLFVVWLVTLAIFFGVLQRLKNRVPAGFAPQAIVVLGSSTPDGQPSPTLAKRLDLALTLAHAYPQAKVITSGGVDFNETVAEGKVMAGYLRDRGLPPARILVEDLSTSTRENLVFSQRAAQGIGIQPGAQMVLVTSDFHTLRAGRIARKAGWSQVATAGAETPLYMRYNAWLREYFACVSGVLFREF